jgi:CHAD domain-containing protein
MGTKSRTRDLPEANGFLGALREQIDDALGVLARKQVGDSQVHSSRKSLKKSRATLRLLRPTIPESAYRSLNGQLRDAARPLSEVRDARILIDALHQLEEKYGQPAARSIPAGLRRLLRREHKEIRKRVETSTKHGLDATRAMLKSTLGRIDHLRSTDGGWSQLSSGLEQVYKKGRKAMHAADADLTTEHLHEWRKQAKYLQYQLKLLEPLHPHRIGKLIERSRALGDCLGDDHDFAVLRAKALAHPDVFSKRNGPGALLALIDRCRNRLQKKALDVGTTLYREKPSRQVARLGRC